MFRTGIHWNYYDNRHPGQVLPMIKQHLARQISRPDCKFFYYGQTDDPVARFDQHQKEMDQLRIARWDSMEVVYGHRSLGFVTDVENKLIEHFAKHPKYDAHGLNTAGTRHAGCNKFFVYVLTDDHPDGGPKTVEKDPAIKGGFEESNKRGDEATRDAAVLRKFERAIRVGPSGAGRPVKLFYIGFTNQPSRRLLEHQRNMNNNYGGNLWEKMQVVFQTPSLDNALRAETLLIKHAEAKYPLLLQNNAPGRFAKLINPDGSESQPYFYVYYLEDRKS